MLVLFGKGLSGLVAIFFARREGFSSCQEPLRVLCGQKSLNTEHTEHLSDLCVKALAGCGKTLHGCHPERSEGSRSAYLLENAQGQILRFALHRTVRGFAQNDSFEEFFRSLLVCCPISNWH